MPRKGIAHETQHAFDLYANAHTVIQEQHRMVHDGFMFTASGKDTAWATGTSKKFLISVPALTFPHIQSMSLTFGVGDVDVVAYEGATASADGSALTAQNVNRNSANTPDLDLFSEPTVTTNGTLIFTLWAPTAGKETGLSNIGQGSEWILKPSTKYLIVLTNNSGGPMDWSHEFSWYEIGEDAE